MITQHPPFTTAQPEDPFYRCIAANRADIFWRSHSKNKPGGEAFFSTEFKDLVQSLLQLDPAQRPTIAEVQAHPWMKGDTATADQVKKEFAKREVLVKKAAEEDKAQKDQEKAKKSAQSGGKKRQAYRAIGQENSGEKFMLEYAPEARV